MGQILSGGIGMDNNGTLTYGLRGVQNHRIR